MMNEYQSRIIRYRHPLIAFFLTLLLLFLHSTYTVKTSSAQHLVTRQVTITQYGFLPQQLTCDSGDTVSLTVINSDSDAHLFTLSTLGVRQVTLASGESSTLTFTANRPGSYAYHSVPEDHPEVTLRGLFTVK